MPFRFAFDLGTASLGWSVFELDENKHIEKLLDCGVRIFSDGRDPQSGESNATARREPKAMRRSRDRYLQRRKNVMNTLIDTGLMPFDEADRKQLEKMSKDKPSPYELRARSLKEKLELHDIGRAFFHINKHRGFKSNRKTDDPDESGKVSDAAKRLATKLTEQNHETLGAFFYSRQSDPDVRKRLPVRIRMDADNKEELYEFYPLRQMLEDEFDLICERQKQFNPDFPDEIQIAQIRNAIFWQRDLKPVEPGYCSFYPDEKRLPRAHPLAQDFILYQKINELRFEDEDGYALPMNLEQRDEMINIVKSGKNLTWVQSRKIMLMPSKSGRISLEESGEKHIVGNLLAARFKGTPKKPGPFLDTWERLSLEQMENLVEAYHKSTSNEELLSALSPFGLDKQCQALSLKCGLPDGYLSISEKAVRQILGALKKQVITYSDACKLAGLHHSDKRDGEVFDRLPYYNMVDELKRHLGHGTGDPNDPRDKRYGRIANPTVHIGLNQLRRTINALMDRYGQPDQIVLELSRELKQNQKQKEEASRKRDQFKKDNDMRREELERTGHYRPGDRHRSREAFIKMRLWEELAKSPNDRRCPYSGEPIISLSQLMSDEVEIEHILPRSKTLDDSFSNKTVAYRQWNRLKRNLSPSEAAERYPDEFDQEKMIAITRTMPANKRWRFHPDAMERFNDEDQFLARQLKETQYLGVMARRYLSKINPGRPDGQMQVWVTTGRLTAELRRKWGLHLGTNYKNRDDHRHHAIDACVIGVIDRSLIKKIADAAKRDEQDEGTNIDRILAHIEEPFTGYCDQVNKQVRKVIISHRPDHSVGGQLHEDAAYGLVNRNDDNIRRGETALGNVVVRRPVSSLTEKQIGQVRDLKIRQELLRVLQDTKADWPDAKDFKKQLPLQLAEWSKTSGTRRVRTLKQESTAIPVGRRKDGARYKYVVPGANHHMDIVETPDGKWHGVAQSVFNANQQERGDGWKAVHPDARFIMRVHKGDTLQLFDDDGTNRIKRIVRINPSANRLFLAEHHQAGNLQKRHNDEDDPFRWDLATISKLKQRRARRARVDPTGRIRTIPHGKQ